MEFETDVFERDTRVGERDHPESGLDDVVTETDDERVGPVRGEFRSVLREYGLERF